jgi:hypothetical protein
MAHKLKALGLAFTVAFVLSGIVASAAQATFPFTVATSPTDLTGSIDPGGTEIFSTAEGSVECGTISFTGTDNATSVSEQSIQPSYSNCTWFGVTANVNASACQYLFTTPTTGAAGERTGEPFHIKCPGGGSITITPTLFGVSICTLRIGEQTPTSGHIIYTNKTDNNGSGKMILTLHTTITGIHYIGSGSAGGTCGANGVTETNLTLTSTTIYRAYKDGQAHTNANQIDITTS